MPDGKFVTGRPFTSTPAGIVGYNTGAFMTEMVGDFDKGKDKLEGKQLEAMLKLQHFLITECGAKIVFHREHAPKTCPGTGIDQEEFTAKVVNYGKRFPYPGIQQEGSRGSHVKLIQAKLGIEDDGIFGPKTKAAVKSWQAKHDLVADGIAGPITWKEMFN
jgi:murein L,D-transpeptidase YcbB/YkuD